MLRLLCEEARYDTHAHKLLDEQLARVGHVDLNNTRLVLVHLAAELLLLEVGHGNEPALLAHVHAVGVRLVKQALLQIGMESWTRQRRGNPQAGRKERAKPS